MVKEQVLEMLEEICEDDVVREDLDINMKEEGLMDSLAFVEMLVRIEEIFGLSIAPTEVTYLILVLLPSFYSPLNKLFI